MAVWLGPQARVTPPDRRRGLAFTLYDGICSQILGVLTGGALLVAFALLLGASNAVIGLIAAVGPLAQIFQLPAILLVERSRLRKRLVVLTAAASRLSWIFVAALPWFLPAAWRIPLFLLSLGVYFALAAIAGCAFNSWMRDLVPDRIAGRYFGRRRRAPR
jgi:hypothetical protein